MVRIGREAKSISNYVNLFICIIDILDVILDIFILDIIDVF